MATPTPAPAYIYKILPGSPVPPTPLPQALPLSALDARDGFLHLSTSHQVLRTVRAFFAADPHVYILRVPYARTAEYIRWEDTRGNAADGARGPWDTRTAPGYFPHIYANDPDGVGAQGLKLGRDEVDTVGRWDRAGDVWGPDGWPFAEDIPQ